MKTGFKRLMTAVLVMLGTGSIFGAGTLTPAESGLKPAEILSHDVKVTINNGFAQTEVTQVFRNSNPGTIEAVYRFPLPQSASFSEVSVNIGEQIINGEVVDRKVADKIYGEEKAKGNNAAKAEKNGYQDFTFAIANLKSGENATIRFVYYQPLPIDTGVARYVYPLEEGNTADKAAESFWTRSSKVSNQINLKMTVKSAWPLHSVRAPGQASTLQTLQLDKGHAELEYDLGSNLSKDFVFYYQLADLPGRLEVIPYRAKDAKEGTFMMVLTPGIDLKALDQGADYVFVLDISGSMQGEKIRTLCDGVAQTLGQMNGNDRFRIVTFDSSAQEHTSGWVTATAENVQKWSGRVKGLQTRGSTNLHEGIATALKGIDDDRVTSLILVTDGVTNTGIVNPQEFHKLLQNQDIRIFGFLMGNNSNWPLMRVICEASGGFYAGVSNSDDIIGQIMLAKSKICFESLHNAQVKISGVKTYDTTGDAVKKLYRGQQLVIFGRYKDAGSANVKLTVKLSGREQTYSCNMQFPAVDTDNPEIERLWAMSRIEMFESLANSGLMAQGESQSQIRDLGIGYQLVTDETSMLVLSDETFKQYNIERRNQARTAIEHAAQSKRAAEPVRNYRVDTPSAAPQQDAQQQPRPANNGNNMFKSNAPRTGGGALGETMVIFGLVMAGLAVYRTAARHAREDSERVTDDEEAPKNS